MNLSLITVFLWIIALFVVGYILVLGKSIFVSLIFTFFIFILLSSLARFIHKFTKNRAITYVLCILVPILFIVGIYAILSTELEAFMKEIPRYKIIFWELSATLESRFWFHVDITSLASNLNFSSLFGSISWGVSNFLGYIGTISFFLLFLIGERKYFVTKIETILEDTAERKFFWIIQKIHADLTLYFGVKFCLAFFNASVSYIVMLLFWLEYALFFALLVFLLDFIPNIWWPVALSFPFLYSFLSFSSPLMSVLLLIILIVPQTITGNIIEPKLVWSRLNLSGFVILLALLFWGSLWGIVGAFLAIPLMTSLNIIFSKFKTTRSLAILLSEKGEVQ